MLGKVKRSSANSGRQLVRRTRVRAEAPTRVDGGAWNRIKRQSANFGRQQARCGAGKWIDHGGFGISNNRALGGGRDLRGCGFNRACATPGATARGLCQLAPIRRQHACQLVRASVRSSTDLKPFAHVAQLCGRPLRLGPPWRARAPRIRAAPFVDAADGGWRHRVPACERERTERATPSRQHRVQGRLDSRCGHTLQRGTRGRPRRASAAERRRAYSRSVGLPQLKSPVPGQVQSAVPSSGQPSGLPDSNTPHFSILTGANCTPVCINDRLTGLSTRQKFGADLREVLSARQPLVQRPASVPSGERARRPEHWQGHGAWAVADAWISVAQALCLATGRALPGCLYCQQHRHYLLILSETGGT